jgi:hypothetical protein
MFLNIIVKRFFSFIIFLKRTSDFGGFYLNKDIKSKTKSYKIGRKDDVIKRISEGMHKGLILRC